MAWPHGIKNPKFKHGMKGTPEYRAWKAMRDRCRHANHFKNYSGRGIKVCDRWDNFMVFFGDVGSQPSPKHTLDRINNNGNYEPGNVRWETRQQQAVNTRAQPMIDYLGAPATIRQAVEAEGSLVTVRLASERIRRGWSVMEALRCPPTPGVKPPQPDLGFPS